MDRVGIGVAVAVLIVGLAIGMWWRGTGGRLRAVGTRTGVRADTGAPPREPDRVDPALLTALGVEPAAATLLQFSSAFCAPCRATRRVLENVARTVPGVAHVEVDAEEHLDLVRALGVLRTPTTVVLDAAGREVTRAAGAPKPAQVLAALEVSL
jgi:thiol-disulfide isomerase/thioredoxin